MDKIHYLQAVLFCTSPAPTYEETTHFHKEARNIATLAEIVKQNLFLPE